MGSEEEDQPIVEDIKRQWIRGAVNIAVLIVEFFWLLYYVRFANWKQRSLFWKVFFFFQMALIMCVFEVFRWADVIIKKYMARDHKDLSNGSPVDAKYIEKNRGYK